MQLIARERDADRDGDHPGSRDGFITENEYCCSRQSYTVPSSVVWIASVTRYVPSSSGTRSNSKSTSPSPLAVGTSTSRIRVFVPNRGCRPRRGSRCRTAGRRSISRAWNDTRIVIASSGSNHVRPTRRPGMLDRRRRSIVTRPVALDAIVSPCDPTPVAPSWLTVDRRQPRCRSHVEQRLAERAHRFAGCGVDDHLRRGRARSLGRRSGARGRRRA